MSMASSMMRDGAKVRQEFFRFCFAQFKIAAIFAPAMPGTLAQLVEQWTENPCVPGSIPGGTTTKIRTTLIIKCLRIFYFSRVFERVLLKKEILFPISFPSFCIR